MIVAGIDEAGYGPLLGPLVVGSAAALVPDADAPPDLWTLLRTAVSRDRARDGRTLHVNDSKKVYSPATGGGGGGGSGGGLAELERGVLAFATLVGHDTRSLDGLLAAVDPDAPRRLARHPWYAAPLDERFPLATTPTAVAIAANGLRAAAAGGVKFPRLAASVLPEGAYNDLVAKTRNKAAALSTVVAAHLHSLLTAGHPRLHILCDRQGGRAHYGQDLRTLFPDAQLTVESESDAHSAYTLRLGQAHATVAFSQSAEQAGLPTALASMLCKYVREALMSRFNHWWTTQCPGLRPTAGYYTDGLRFLADTQAMRTSLAVPDADLIRSR